MTEATASTNSAGFIRGFFAALASARAASEPKWNAGRMAAKTMKAEYLRMGTYPFLVKSRATEHFIEQAPRLHANLPVLSYLPGWVGHPGRKRPSLTFS